MLEETKIKKSPKGKKLKKNNLILPEEPAESEKITKAVEDLNMNVELTKSQLNRGSA